MRRTCLVLSAMFALILPLRGAMAAAPSLLYAFTGGTDGAYPAANLIADAAGALYGTTKGDSAHRSTVFKLSPPPVGLTAWTMSVLFTFAYNDQGKNSVAPLLMDDSGALYGTTEYGGDPQCSCGVVFKLTPPALGQTAWTEQVLHKFAYAEGANPLGGVVMDASGALYGTTIYGDNGHCPGGCGVVFKLTPPAAGKTAWAYRVIYRVVGDANVSYPAAGLIIDAAGNLYGTGYRGGVTCCNGFGVVFELTPPASPAGAWRERALYRFGGGFTGSDPLAPVTMDNAGNLYGTASFGRSNNNQGVVYRLTPGATAADHWVEKVICVFRGGDGATPLAGVTVDPSGAVFGTTSAGGAGLGNVFELTPPAPGTSHWPLTVLYTFHHTIGGTPLAGLIEDAGGALYGTASRGGKGYGTIFKIVP